MTGIKEDITYEIPYFGCHYVFTHKEICLIMYLNTNRVEKIFIKDRVIFLFLYKVKCYLYLIKSAHFVIWNNCTVLSLNISSHSLPSEQGAAYNNVSDRAKDLMASDARTI
jgi:hypothetical protein